MTSSWFFLSTLNYHARSTTHQIHCGLFALGEANWLRGCPPWPRILRLSSIRWCPKSLWTKTLITFPLRGLPFDLRSLTVKPELCSSNQSGNESLLVLVKSRHWQLCTLLLFCFAMRSLGTQCALPSSNLNLCGLLHGLLHDQLWFVSYYAPIMLSKTTPTDWRNCPTRKKPVPCAILSTI